MAKLCWFGRFKQAIPNIDPKGKGKRTCHSWPEPRPIENTKLWWLCIFEQASRTPPHKHKSCDLWTGWPEPNLSTDSKLWCFSVWKGLLGPRLTNYPSIRLYPVPFFDSGTSWLGVGTSWPKVRYEFTKNGYVLTKVRVDLGTSWLETVRGGKNTKNEEKSLKTSN